MKKIILTALCAVLVQLSFAQIQQGTWTATGSSSYSQFKRQNNNQADDQLSYNHAYKSFQLRPSIGYFVTNNVEIGVFGGYSYSDQLLESFMPNVSTNSAKYEVATYSAGLFTRAYKFIANNFAFYGQANVGYASSSIYNLNEVEGTFHKYMDETDTDSQHLSVSILPGITFFVHDRISLNATYGVLSYSRSDNEHKRKEFIFGQASTHEFNSGSHDLSLNLSSDSFSLGLSYYFR